MAGSGRQRGSGTRWTGDIKDAVIESFRRVGGPAWLVKLAEEQPVAYAGLLSKMLPRDGLQAGQGLTVVVHTGLPPRGQDRQAVLGGLVIDADGRPLADPVAPAVLNVSEPNAEVLPPPPRLSTGGVDPKRRAELLGLSGDVQDPRFPREKGS